MRDSALFDKSPGQNQSQNSGDQVDHSVTANHEMLDSIEQQWRTHGIIAHHYGWDGSGKTSILAEASDLLALRQITHAAIDVDALGLARLPSEACNDATMYINLRSVGKNYAACGVQRFLVARAMEGRAELDRCRHIFSTANTVVCRLTASIATMEHRVKMREIGVSRRDYVARVAKLNGILDDVRLEDFTVSNENRSSTDVALEMLVKAGWISH